MKPLDGDQAAIRRQSRIAGFWYLVLAVLSPLNLVFVPGALVKGGDAAATAAAIAGAERLFRLGMVTGIAGQIAFLVAGLAFYDLFKAVDKRQGRILLILVIASVPVAVFNAINQAAVLLIADGAGYLEAFTRPQRDAAILFFLKLTESGFHIAGFFWGLWLLPLGVLTLKSAYFPRLFGILLLVGAGGYTVNSTVVFLFPEFVAPLAPAITIAQMISEIPFLLWLLIRGARPRPTVGRTA